MHEHFVTHESPLLGAEADLIVLAEVEADDEGVRHMEQLWCKRSGEGSAVMCCVPFFLYGVALGDEVAVEKDRTGRLVVGRVLRRSGRTVFRVILHSEEPYAREAVQRLERWGAALEWWIDSYVALDLPSSEARARAAEDLDPLEASGLLEYEFGN